MLNKNGIFSLLVLFITFITRKRSSEQFLSTIDENPIGVWEKAFKWKNRRESIIEYYYEKLRLLKLAEPQLFVRSVIGNIYYGMRITNTTIYLVCKPAILIESLVSI